MKELLLTVIVLAAMGGIAYFFHTIQTKNNSREKIEERYQEYRRSIK